MLAENAKMIVQLHISGSLDLGLKCQCIKITLTTRSLCDSKHLNKKHVARAISQSNLDFLHTTFGLTKIEELFCFSL